MRQGQKVIRWVLAGKKDKEIGAKMLFTARTIENNRHNAMAKLGGHNAVELVQTAMRLGLNG